MAKGTKVLNRVLKVNDIEELFITVSDAAPLDDDIDDSEISLYLDAGDGNKLKIKGRIGETVYTYVLTPV
ncbi:MAG: hypothetical protein ACPGYV_10255 [Phycisphaeraceae bacterium]